MTEIFEEPLRELIVTLSAWKRLISKAEELATSDDTKFAGLYILHKMRECMTEAERDMKDNEKTLRKKMKEALADD